jgi:GR25 family glycosyltransferase involved in LPS biosynthesis
MENEHIYMIGMIIILTIIAWYCYQQKKDIFQYSLMVHLDNDESSQKRIQQVKQIYDEYNLPMNLMKATHWKHDAEELKMYPLDKDKITGLNIDYRPGAYGLAGSFYKCLKHARDNDWPHLLFLEDDAVPILPKDKFYDRLDEVMSTLPDNGEGIYMLGSIVWCQTNPNDKIEWKQYKDLETPVHGTHSIYFGKQSIHKMMNYIQQNKIDLAIDNFINKFPDVWYWYGDLSENGMFRGLYKQYGINCHNVRSYDGPINNS